MSYITILAFSLAVCFSAQTVALRMSGGRTVKSESNFFSSLGRIQAGAGTQPDVMLLGSSITGRLPDQAQGFSGWANMGCDGGTAVDALRAMDEGILPAADTLVIEANTLQLALGQKESEISRAMRAPWFQVGIKVPQVSAYARPAAFFYSPLLAMKIGSNRMPSDKEDLGVVTTPEIPASSSKSTLSAEQESLVCELQSIITRLRERGCQTYVIWLPPARSLSPHPPAWILEWCRRSSIPYWDLGQDADPSLIRLTDSIHMDAASATLTVRSLQKIITE